MAEQIVSRPEALQLGPVRTHGIGWNGVACLVASESALFVYLLFSYYYLGAVNRVGWVLETHPSMKLALPDTALLIASSFVAMWGEKGIRTGRRGQALAGIGIAIAMGAVFVAVQIAEWSGKSYGLSTNSYAALYFLTTGFHMVHVVVGLVILAAIFLWTALGYFGPVRQLSAANGILYWHFVDIVWLFVFATYYLTPYLGFGT